MENFSDYVVKLANTLRIYLPHPSVKEVVGDIYKLEVKLDQLCVTFRHKCRFIFARLHPHVTSWQAVYKKSAFGSVFLLF